MAAGTIYSRWRPDTGGYDYFRAPESYNLNDDLPTPQLVPASKIGVPSIEAGRPIPLGSVPVGSGSVAIGLIAPVDDSRLVRRSRSLAGTDGIMSPGTLWLAAGVLGAVAVWHFSQKS